MRVINIVKDLKPIRMGVWLAAINTAPYLKSKYNIASEVWFPGPDFGHKFQDIEPVPISSKNIEELSKLIIQRNLDPKSDIIVTHSPWDYQSKWGNYLADKGFKWVFVPQGTLEPWSLSQKWLKKKLYFSFLESKRLARANVIKASSSPELHNLNKMFDGKEVVLIPNGVDPILVKDGDWKAKEKSKKIFLFMARLHHKKGVYPLVKAWLESELNDNEHFELVIAGPDDGELDKIKPLLARSNNARYIGPIYGDEKEKWLSDCTFYVLPSQSEGFPTSLLETSGKGLITIISEGCNFPELEEAGLTIKVGTTAGEIIPGLNQAATMTTAEIDLLSANARKFIKDNYSLGVIADLQFRVYSKLMKLK